MTTLNINGRRVKVGDDFKNLSPEQQNATVEEIARSLGGEVEQPSQAASQLDDYYSSGIFAGEYNPLGAVARSLDAATTWGGDVLTAGFGDELVGIPTGQTQAIRDRQEVLGETNPIASTVGMIGGGLGAGLSLGPASITARTTTAATPLLGRAAAGMADGAIAGGIYGLGSGEGMSDRLWQGAIGAGIGGAFGAAFPVVADGIGRGVKAFRNSQQASRIARQAGTDQDSLRLLGRIMENDGSLGSQGQANMRRAGQDAMLVDAGPNARQMLDYSIQRGGPGAVTARNAVSDRVGRASRALGQTLDDTMGAPQGVGSAQNAIRDGSRAQVGGAYNRAYSSPIDYASPAGRRVEDVVNRIPPRIARQAIQRANEQINYDGLGRQIMADIAEDGAVTFREMPSVVQADHIKRALDAIANDATDPITGRLNSDGAFASRMARDLRNAVGDAVPAYREALETAADPLSRQNAVRIGSRLNSMTRDEFGMAVEGMTKPEQQAVLQGFRSKLDDQMASVTRAMTDGNMDAREAIRGLRELSSRRTQENIRAVMPKGQADRLFNEIDQITTAFELRASVASNSATATRAAAKEFGDSVSDPGVVGRMARAEPLNASQRIVQNLTGYTDDYLRGLQDTTYSNLARLLTRPGGAGRDVYNAIGQLDQTDQATKLMTDRIAALLSAPRLAYPAGALTQESLR